MKILACDTTGSYSSLALVDDKGTIVSVRSRHQLSHAEDFFLLVEIMLAQAGWWYQDLDYIGVTVGPGSFTGVRIGVAAVKGIRLVCPVPIYPITNFELVIARDVPLFDNLPGLVVLNAKKGYVYVQTFDSGLLPASEPVLASYDAVIEHVPGNEFFIAGNGLSSVDFLWQGSTFSVHTMPASQVICPASAVASVVARKSAACHDHTTALAPLYIRDADIGSSLS